MSGFKTVEVPFVVIGNRRALTDKQIAEQPWLSDFIDRFPTCFEYDPDIHAWFFYDYPTGAPSRPKQESMNE